MTDMSHELWWRYSPCLNDPRTDVIEKEVVRAVLAYVEREWRDPTAKVRKLFAIAKCDDLKVRLRSAATLALTLERREEHCDQQNSLIFIAALMRNPIAIASMALILKRQVYCVSDEDNKMTVATSQEYWCRTAERLNLTPRSLVMACFEIKEADRPSIIGAPPAEIADLIDSHSLQVISSIGDNESSEGRRFEKIYSSLLGHLPLKAPAYSLEVLEAQMQHEFPWFEDLTDSFIRKLRLRTNAGVTWFRLPPTLLVGPPGCGKTRYLQRLSELSGCGHQIFSAGGSSDNRMLMGTARGWGSTQPCLPLVAMHIHNCANPFIIVDEVEKAHTSHHGGVHGALLSFLETTSSRTYFDESLLTRANLGEVSWFATANSLGGIPSPLLSRFNIYKVAGPDPEHFEAIFDGLLDDCAKELGIRTTELPNVARSARAQLQQAFVEGKSIRQIKRALSAAIEHGEWRPVLH